MSPRFGFVGPSYTAQSVNADAQELVNWYPEIDESQAGNSPIALYPTPGTKKFATLAAAFGITKTHSGNFTQGQLGATFTVTVSNVGPVPSQGPVTVTETPPAGLTFVSMSGTGWTVVGNVASRTDSLAPGASYPVLTVVVNVRDDATSPQVNQSSVLYGQVVTISSDSVIVNPFTPPPSPPLVHNGVVTGYFGITNTGVTGPTPININFDIAIGEVMFLGVFQIIDVSAAPVIIAITDEFGNTWVPVSSQGQYDFIVGQNRAFRVWMTVSSTHIVGPGSFNVFVTAGVSPNAPDGNMQFFSVDNIGALDQMTEGVVTGDSTPAAPPITFAGNRFLVTWCEGSQGHLTITPPFFTQVGDTVTGYAAAAAYWDGSQFTAAAGTYTPTWNNTGPLDAYCVNAAFNL